MKTAWTHDDLQVNLEGIVNDVKWIYGIDSIDEIPSCELVPNFQLDQARIGDVIQLKNGKNALIFDVVETSSTTELVYVTNSYRIGTKRF